MKDHTKRLERLRRLHSLKDSPNAREALRRINRAAQVKLTGKPWTEGV